MSSNKAIQGLQKQNDSIYSSLVSKNIQFERTVIPDGVDEQEHLRLLGEENSKLKDVVKASKPPTQPKVEKPAQQTQQTQQVPKAQEKKKENKEEGEDEEENFEEPVKKFETITNMEDMKRAFFSGDIGLFEEQLKAHQFVLYNVRYKYDSDKDGVPEFSAKNLLKGFVRNFDDYRKYFMICFRCWKSETESKYKYDSYWIVNSNVPVQDIIGSTWEDFEFESSNDIDGFISQMKKLPESEEPVYIGGYTCIGESYVH